MRRCELDAWNGRHERVAPTRVDVCLRRGQDALAVKTVNRPVSKVAGLALALETFDLPVAVDEELDRVAEWIDGLHRDGVRPPEQHVQQVLNRP
jgi:hypothetical protein